MGNAGSLSVDAQDVQLIGTSADGRLPSALSASAQLNSTGDAGNLTIKTNTLLVRDGAQVGTATLGEGKGGSLSVDAQHVQLIGTTADIQYVSGLFASTQSSTGDAGDLTIKTNTLLVRDGAQILTTTFGAGKGGFLRVDAQDVQIIGTSANNQFASGLFAPAQPNSTGNAGDLTIKTNTLLVRDGAQILAGTFGVGKGGDLSVDAQHVQIIGTSANNRFFSVLSASAGPNSTGNAGDLTIKTNTLLVRDGAQVNTTTSGAGKGGSLIVDAQDVQIIGTSADSQLASGLNTSALRNSTGDAGDLMIATGSLLVTNGGQLNALTFGQGRAGNVKIIVRDVASFDGSGSNNRPSGVLTGVVENAAGDGGDLSIMAGSLRLTNGATLSAITLGQGRAGNINITVRDAVLLEGIAQGGTGIFTTVGEKSEGNGGTINLRAASVSIIGDGAIAADTNGQGQGGNINLDVKGTILLDGSGGATASAGESSRITLGVQPRGNASGGNLRINAGALVLQNGGLVKASTQGQADAGNIDITADVVDISGSVPSSGLPSGLFTSSDTAGNAGDIIINTQTFRIADGAALSARSRGDGQGGDITVNAARSFEALNGGQLITTTFGRAQAGSITLKAAEQLTIAGSDPNYAARLARFPNPVDPFVANAITETGAASGLFANTEPNSAGRGGDIQIATGQLTVQEGARMITSTSGSGRAGDITVSAPDIHLSGGASGLLAQTTSAGDAGNLTIQPLGNEQSVRVNLQDGAQISASTSSSGKGGELTITAPESITLTGNGSVIAAETGGSGTGGNLNLKTGTLNIQNQAQVTVSSEGTGRAGSLFVDANQIYLDNGGRIRADTSGGGGDINLRSPLILLRNGSSITTNARGSDIPGGNIDINTDNLVAVPAENSDISANSANFRGGKVTITASGIFGIEFQEQLTPLSDITATGVTSGIVNLILLAIDPSRGLAELPTGVVDAADAIATGCAATEGNSFVVTGRGGLPPNPEQQLDDDAEWLDRRQLTVPQQTTTRQNQSNQHSHGSRHTLEGRTHTRAPIVEATGWQITPTGQVMLVANTPDSTRHNPSNQSITCQGGR